MKEFIFINIVNLIAKTWRIEIKGEFPINNSGIIVFWHGVMLPCWFAFRKYNPLAVVSPSKDGQILSILLQKWNFDLIRGSSDKNSKNTLSEITEKAASNIILLTPDGPKGPIKKIKNGAIIAASRGNSNLYSLNVKIGTKIIFNNSWDKFQFPLPFSKIEIFVSDGIKVNDTDGLIDLEYYKTVLYNNMEMI